MTNFHPPHLPPKSSSIQLHKAYHSIVIFLVYTFVAVLAGIVGALAVFVWFEPNLYSQGSLYFINRDSVRSYVTERYPNSDVVARLRNVSLRIFDARKTVEKSFFPDDAYLGRVVMLSSSGWGVAFVPEYSSGLEQTWTIIDQNGLVQDIEKIVFDGDRNLLYLKFEGGNFYVNSFPPWYEIVPGVDLWIADHKVWHKRIVEDTVVIAKAPYRAIDEYSQMLVDSDGSSGSVVMTNGGQIVGFVTETGLLQSLWHTQFQLPYLLEHDTLKKDEIGLRGYFVDSVSQNSQTPSSGFYVTHSTRDTILVGDIVIRVAGDTAGPHNFWQQILSAGESFSMMVWRENQEFDILVTR